MKPDTLPQGLDAMELNRLHDAALQRAGRQRDAAIEAFWRRAAIVLWARLSTARRLPAQPRRQPAGDVR